MDMALFVYIVSFMLSVFLHVIDCHESIGLTFELPNNEKLCFYEEFKREKRYIFSFTVLKGGLRDVDVRVEAPNSKELYEGSKAQKGEIEFYTSWGKYGFCFSNEFSAVLHKVIYFELRPEEHKPLAVEAGVKLPTANTQIEETMEDLHRATSDVIAYQRKYRVKEAEGRYIAESVNRGVFWYSLVQAIIIIVVMTSQVGVLKCFFTHKRASTAPDEDADMVRHQPPAQLF